MQLGPVWVEELTVSLKAEVFLLTRLSYVTAREVAFALSPPESLL